MFRSIHNVSIDMLNSHKVSNFLQLAVFSVMSFYSFCSGACAVGCSSIAGFIIDLCGCVLYTLLERQ